MSDNDEPQDAPAPGDTDAETVVVGERAVAGEPQAAEAARVGEAEQGGKAEGAAEVEDARKAADIEDAVTPENAGGSVTESAEAAGATEAEDVPDAAAPTTVVPLPGKPSAEQPTQAVPHQVPPQAAAQPPAAPQPTAAPQPPAQQESLPHEAAQVPPPQPPAAQIPPQAAAQEPPQQQPPAAQVPPQPAQPQPPAAPQPAAFGAAPYPAPDASGQLPSGPYPNQPPAPALPGHYPPYQGPSPYSSPYQQYPQQPATPARPSGPPPLTGFDFVGSILDAGRALLAGFISVLISLLVVIYAGVPNPHVSAGDFYKFSTWLLGSSLGAPITGSGSVSADNGFGSSMSASLGITLRITVWALTFIVLFLLYALARRREKQAASRSLGQLFLRSALTALAVSVILLVLALTSSTHNLFGSGVLGSATGLSGMSESVGLGAGYVFLGPLLLTLAVSLLGRFGIWLHAPTTADPRAERAKAAIDKWRPAVRTAWQQMSVMGTLIAVGLWIWLAVDIFQDPSTSSYRTAILLGALVLLPNLAVYGTFLGMGVTLFAGGGFGASILGQSTGSSIDAPTSGSSALGILQGEHPWGVWLLLGGVIVGTLAPAVLARSTRRFAVNRDEYALNGAWRSVLVGLVTALAVVLLGALSLSMSGSEGDLGSMSVTLSLGPSLLGALGLSALWFLLAYLALSLSLGHRFQPAGPRQPAVPPQGTPEYAQYVQYQQYLQQQQQYQQYQPQFAQSQQSVPVQGAPDQGAGQTVTVPLAQSQPTQVSQPLAAEPAAQQAHLEQSVPAQQAPGEEPTQVVAQAGSGTHELPPEQFPSAPYPQPQQDGSQSAQQYAQQYPQQYAQPYPDQQYPAQWAPPGQSGPWPQQPAMPGQPGPRTGLRKKIAIPLVLVVLAGGGFLAYHFIAGGSGGGPAGAVTAYFNDLAAGDAKDAVALAEGPYDGTTVADSAATLADPANRPTDFSVVSTRKPTASEQQNLSKAKFAGTNPTMVIVKYTVRGKQLTDLFVAMQNAQGKWVLPSPYLYLTVTGGWSDKATVDGVSFKASEGVMVFPGAHVIAEPDNPDFAKESTTIVPQDYTADGETYTVYGSDGGGSVSLPAPSLSSAGQAAVQTAYGNALNDCATQAETGTGDCGIDNYYDYNLCNNVTWTISTVGTVTVDLSSQQSDGSFSWSSDGTVATESGDYYDFSGVDQTFSDQSTNLQNSGTVVFNSDGSATVTITS
jgi:hypothetical protein